jgi:hypothetical protein
VTVSLDSNQVYDALSYMWYNSKPFSNILLEGKPLPIAENLSNALRHLRPPQQGIDSTQAPLRIWIDAICINQDDVKERNAQVSVMRTIYSNSSLVRIWIYEPNINASSEQVKRLQHFNELLDAAETKESRRSVMASLTYWQPVLPIFENPYWHESGCSRKC